MKCWTPKTRPKLQDLRHQSRCSLSPPASPPLAPPPCSPRLEKLGIVPAATEATSPVGRSKGSLRLKELREQTQVRTAEAIVQAEHNQQEQQRSFLYHTRWSQLRHFYAITSEVMAVRQSSRKAASPISPMGCVRRPAPWSPSPTPATTPASTSTAAAAPPTTTWLRDVASEFRRSFTTSPEVTIAQVEIAVTRALRIELLSPPFAEIAARLKSVFQAFQQAESLKVDFRELLCALLVLDRWRLGEKKLVLLWFEEFSVATGAPKVIQAVPKKELRRMLFTACEGKMDEKNLMPFIQELLDLGGGAAGTSFITERAFTAYVESHAAFVATLKAQCWKRLTDDMRLAFYRDLFVHASDHLEQEQLRFRMQSAMQLWRSREPRHRLARWKRFVADQKLFRRSEAHFHKKSSQKVVRALLQQRRCKQQMRESVGIAQVQYHGTLSYWAFQTWKLFWVSMQRLYVVGDAMQNNAAWQRSVRHWRRVWKRKTWTCLVNYYADEKAHRAARQARLDAFIAGRHRNILRASMDEWRYYYRRCKEVADARLREQLLHRDLYDQRQLQAESAQMAIEDAISRAVETKTREREELARQRAFQDATQRVHANRKTKQQEDERTRVKQEREAAMAAQMDATWQSIEAKLCVEVRQSTLAWFATQDGKAAYQQEGARIFEQDPAALQKALLQDPDAFALRGCRWQLQLEDYGGRFAKPFYLNTETFEKLMCEELILDSCEEIAKEVLIQRRIDAAKLSMNAKASQVSRSKLEHTSALKIQALFRCRHALLATRSLIRAMFVKRIDPSSGDTVYFNIKRVETRRRPPKLIGSDEPLIPVESATWVRRVDDEGNMYYIRIDIPPGGTGSSQQAADALWSWTPPAHFIMCARCKINFATRRCNETGVRFCIGCYADGLHRRRFDTDDSASASGHAALTWTKLPVQPAKCIVCRNALADVVCHPCRGDASCLRCFDAVHRNNPKFMTHEDRDFLSGRERTGQTQC